MSKTTGNFEGGVDAYKRGDYGTAMTEFRPLADQGHADSQLFLGLMYAEGQGMPQDKTKAAKWFRLAADQGHAMAQVTLGVMNANGHGVPQDFVLGYMCVNLAASQGHESAVKSRKFIAAVMGSQQIIEAQRLAREWKPK